MAVPGAEYALHCWKPSGAVQQKQQVGSTYVVMAVLCGDSQKLYGGSKYV